MIRVSEFVLPGHPDKFCDGVADAIIGEVLKVDADGYGQVEVSVWADQVFLTGGVCTRTPIPVDFADVVVATGIDVGYTDGKDLKNLAVYWIIALVIIAVLELNALQLMPWKGEANKGLNKIYDGKGVQNPIIAAFVLWAIFLVLWEVILKNV